METTLSGILFHYLEGPGASYWAFQDSRFISDKTWSFRGLHAIEDGDTLTVLSPDDSKNIIWSGVIRLEKKNGIDLGCQKGLGRKTWATWFMGEYPARLVKSKQ